VGTFLKLCLAAALAACALLGATAGGTSASGPRTGVNPLDDVLALFDVDRTPADPTAVLSHDGDDGDSDNSGSGDSGSGKDGDDGEDNSGEGGGDDGDDSADGDDETSPQDGQDDDKGVRDRGVGNGNGKGQGDEHGKRRRRHGSEKLPPVSTPVLMESFNVKSSGGKVKVRLPDADHFAELEDDAGLPVGSLVNTRKGAVTLTSAANADGETQTAVFYGELFQVRQRGSKNPVTELVLKGRKLRGCKRGKGHKASTSRKRKTRRLWGRGKGRFRTRGRHSAASVRGTIWLTEDRCDGTLTKVRRGEVAVRDFKRKRTVLVHAGESYLAKKAYR
jgi:hypothetical protein